MKSGQAGGFNLYALSFSGYLFLVQPQKQYCNKSYKVNCVQCNLCNCQHILHEVEYEKLEILLRL